MSDHKKETTEPPSEQQQLCQNNSLKIINILYILLSNILLDVPSCKYVKQVLKVQDIFMAVNDNNCSVSIVWVNRSVKTLSGRILTAAILNNYYANNLFTISYELRNRTKKNPLKFPLDC